MKREKQNRIRDRKAAKSRVGSGHRSVRAKPVPCDALYKAAHAYVKRLGGEPIVQGGVVIISRMPGWHEREYVLGVRFVGGPVPSLETQP